MSAKRIQKRLESTKKVAPHMWVLFKTPTGAYGVSLGNPASPSSQLKAVFPNKHELKEWVRSNVGFTVSADHVIDKTGLRLVSPKYSDFYLQMRG